MDNASAPKPGPVTVYPHWPSTRGAYIKQEEIATTPKPTRLKTDADLHMEALKECAILKAERDRLTATNAELVKALEDVQSVLDGNDFQTHDCPRSMNLSCRICAMIVRGRAALRAAAKGVKS